MNEAFYSHNMKCRVKQVNKFKARKLWDEGREIYLHPCNMDFDSVRQRPILVGRNNFDCQGWSFDDVVHHNEVFNCDSERGKYMHYFVKVSINQ